MLPQRGTCYQHVQHLYNICGFSLCFHFISFWIFLSSLCGLLRDEEGKVFMLCKEIGVTLLIVSVKQLGSDSQLRCSA